MMPTDAIKLEARCVKSLRPLLELSDTDQTRKKPETNSRQKNEDEGVHIHVMKLIIKKQQMFPAGLTELADHQSVFPVS